VFVKVSLILNYLGQGAWLLANHKDQSIPLQEIANGFNPFISIMPQWFKLAGITISTIAAIIASQALIYQVHLH
jgi:KUP system potassium uptake protein